MSKKLQQHIFESEYHNTTRGTSNEKGTGLGLKLCKEYLEKQAGNIRLESKKGKGSVVTFTMPLK